ncbi:MAG: DNA polymerase I [Candidatus Omnitrophica bacterium]|nr:DNA polymerase I [Candidatus Omnitrophota bacterium]
MPKETVYLVDGTSLCYRSFFAIKLSNSQGVPTGSVYGVYQTLKKIISKYNPSYLGVCFDVSRKTFRQDKFKEYKIQRPPMPDDLGTQIPLVKKLISYLGIKIVEKKNFEADDVIATLCKQATSRKKQVVIVSSDKDLYQLLENDEVSIYSYHKDKFTNRSDFIKENGFKPEEIIDYLALAGDASDNIPGARGIGKVGASKLVKEFKTVENIFNNLDKVSPKMQTILKESKETVFLSKELVTLETPALELSCDDLKIDQIDTKGLYDMFSEFEFKAFLKDLPAPKLEIDLAVKTSLDKKAKENLVKEPLPLVVSGNDIFIFDQFKNCIYKLALSEAEDILTDQKIKKLSHGFREKMADSASAISKLQGVWFDTKIAAYLLDSSLIDYELEAVVNHYLGEHTNQIPDELKPYFIYKLYQLFLETLKKQSLDKLFFEVEVPLIEVLSQMQAQGVKVQAKVLTKLLEEVEAKVMSHQAAVFKAAGHEFNLNSPKQLSLVLFQELGIPPVKKTKTGYSTNEEVLEKLSLDHSIAKDIIEHRHLNKLKNTYIMPLIQEVKANKGMLHTQFHQTKAQTGRLSSSGPNLQSIPVKGEFSNALRRAFVPKSPDGCILSGDYSQIELRILAHLSKDKELIKAFRDNLDIHTYTASLLFGKKNDKVSELERNVAKTVNFGIIYGMSSYGLVRELKISNIEAQNFIDDYFKRYPGVKAYSEEVKAQANKQGFVTTILGRQRRIPEVKSPNLKLREFALRQAVNAPIQGSCADIIKVAMIKIYNQLKQEKLQAKLTIQIHDELIFDLPKSELSRVSALVRKQMEGAVDLEIPVKVNLKAGNNWGDLENIQ